MSPYHDTEVPCPTCEGTGQVIKMQPTLVCCGNYLRTGECCSNPVPGLEPEPDLCGRCLGSGSVPA